MHKMLFYSLNILRIYLHTPHALSLPPVWQTTAKAHQHQPNVIKGVTKDDAEDEHFLYKGIANRAFERVFTINDKVEIKDAEMVNGMLKVWLENIVKTQDAIKKIGIKGE